MSRITTASTLLAALLSPALALAADGPPATLNLASGGRVEGTLKDSTEPGQIVWQGDAFAGPFHFGIDAVNAVHWQGAAATPADRGGSCVELVGGDLVLGDVIALDDRAAVVDTPKLGRLTIPRDRIRRIDRRGEGSGLVYLGPNGMNEWRPVNESTGWREEGGQLVADKELAAIQANLGLPARSVMEFVLSWKTKADFVLALGIDGPDKAVKQPLRHAFRFEIWENELVAQRETEDAADVASLGPIAAGAGRIHLVAYLDQEAGRLIVATPDGRTLADLKVKGGDAEARPAVHLATLRGDLRLEQLRVARWQGDGPADAATITQGVRKVDGSTVTGAVRRDEGATGYTVATEEGDQVVADVDVSAVTLAPARDEPVPPLRVVYQDGNRLSGSLERIADGRLWLKLPGAAEPLSLALEGLRSLVVLHPEAKPTPIGGEVGRLEAAGLSLPGQLVDAVETPEATCLAWQPVGSRLAASLRKGIAGRLVYKEPAKVEPVSAQKQAQMIAMQRAVALRVQGAQAGSQPMSTPKGTGPLALHLRSGDIIPAEITRISEEGVWFKTPLSDSSFVAHNRIKAAELAHEGEITVKLTKQKFDRLTTLPRMQRDSPPTQLIRSKNGDFIRGRLMAMDDRRLQVELRLEPKEIPRDRVAQILWLHPDELDPSQVKPVDAPELASRIQAVRGDGTRLTFLAERVESSAILGTSDVLGPCRVKITDVDQFLIGGEIESAATQLAYQQWKLHKAEEPKDPTPDDGGDEGAGRGTESPLVGKPAPEIKLSLLDGKPFNLAEQKGHVVILDFWATWCGPCIQAMPQVEKVAEEFQDRGVQLIAVNLEESPQQIKSMLERHKLNPTVALDRDGVAGRRYQANAIPQTVIIDAEGKVARLFVGGGPKLGDQLREALNTILEAKQD